MSGAGCLRGGSCTRGVVLDLLQDIHAVLQGSKQVSLDPAPESRRRLNGARWSRTAFSEPA